MTREVAISGSPDRVSPDHTSRPGRQVAVSEPGELALSPRASPVTMAA